MSTAVRHTQLSECLLVINGLMEKRNKKPAVGRSRRQVLSESFTDEKSYFKTELSSLLGFSP